MTTGACQFALNEQEYELLLRMLEQALNDCRKEEHRSETFAYREFLQQRQSTMEGLIGRLRQCCEGGSDRDQVELASEGSFPASDAPAWTPVQSVGGPKRGNVGKGHPDASRGQAPRQPK